MFNPPVNNYQTPTPPTYTAPQPNMQITALAQRYGVSPVDVMTYAQKLGVSPEEAVKHVAADVLWKRVATEHKVLTGDPGADALKLHQHWQYAHGKDTRDPLHDNPEAMQKFQDESLKLAQENLTNA